MKNEHDYFRKYFAISELLAEKERMLAALWDTGKQGRLSEAHYASNRDIAVINALILDEEARLQGEVAAREAEGTAFAFEAYARRRLLNRVERRLILYFLHLDLYRVGSVVVERRLLAGVLDCEDTAASRGGLLLDLYPGGRFDRRKLVTVALGESQVRLAVPLRDRLRRLVSGRKERILRQNTETETDIDIGQVCAPECSIKDIVLPPEKIREVLLHVDTHEQMKRLGLMDGVSRGKGLGMIFYGPPGTGKSMLAHALAAHTGRKILQVNVSQIKSKWVGESEKNIVRLFRTARAKKFLLCLDEADSLIASREGALHGYELSSVNVFLEEVEKFDGMLVMTTNMAGRLDPAIERRVSLRVKFEVPEPSIRAMIWRRHIPASVKCADDIDWQALGERFVISGGYIKNAALSAMRHMLARREQTLLMQDLMAAGEAESRNMCSAGNKMPVGFSGR